MEATIDIDDLDFTQQLHERQVRRVYLITYSQANMEEFPSCETFVTRFLKFFEQDKEDPNPPTQYACCQENHANGGAHYHLVIQFEKPRRWNPMKRFMYSKYGVSLHFSSQSYGYKVAYNYICKEKPYSEVLHSHNHPNLEMIGSPKTKKGMKAYSEKAKVRRESNVSLNQEKSTPTSSKQFSKVKRLSNMDVSEFMIKNNIRHESQLMAISNERHAHGEKDYISL